MDIGPPLILQNLTYTIDNENRVIFQGHRTEFKVDEDNTEVVRGFIVFGITPFSIYWIGQPQQFTFILIWC